MWRPLEDDMILIGVKVILTERVKQTLAPMSFSFFFVLRKGGWFCLWNIVVFNLFGLAVSVKNLLGAGVVFLILSVLAVVIGDDLSVERSFIKKFLVGWGFLLLCGVMLCIGIGLLCLIGWCFNLIK